MWKTRRAELEALLLALLYAVYLSPLVEKTVLMIFHNRDIARGYDLLSGRIALWGPEVTGGGHLPGPFYYFLLALPLLLGLGWKGTFFLLTLFQGAAVGVLWWFFRRCFGLGAALLGLCCFASAFSTLGSVLAILNASYSYFFSAAIAISLAIAYGGFEQRYKVAALRAAFLFLALGLQLHLSLCVFAGVILLLQLVGTRGGLSRPSWKDFVNSLLFLFPLLPFTIWRAGLLVGIKLGHQPSTFLEVAGGFSNFLRVGYFSPLGPLTESNRYLGFWFTVKLFLAQARSNLLDLGGLTWPCLVLSFGWLGWFLWRKIARKKREANDGICLVLLACALFGTIPALVGMGGGFHIWRYTGCFAVSYVLFCAACFGSLLSQARGLQKKAHSLISAAALAVSAVYLGFFGPLSPAAARIESDWSFATFVRGSEFEKMARTVKARTGWSYEQFRLRAFYLNVFNEVSPEAIYEELDRGGLPAIQEPADPPDGYFVAKRQFPQDWTDSEKDSTAWLLTQRLPATLAEGIRSGGISLGEVSAIGSLLLIPYDVRDKDRFPPYFQNRAEDYRNTQEQRISAALAEQKARPRQVLVAELNDCPGALPVCRYAVVVRAANLGGPARTFDVEILGLPLSQASQYISNDWTQALLEPYAGFLCEGAREPVKVVLASAIGFHVVDYWVLNHSFLAPYRRELRVDCKGKPATKIIFGYAKATAMSHSREIPLPAAEWSFPLPR